MQFNKPKVFAVKHKNFETRMLSRSGGVFTAVSDAILEKKGIIYGSILNKDLLAEHIRADNVKKRDKMRGSKYIQSNMNSIFQKVKNDLEQGFDVLFTGTSCQVSGLKSFLQKDYENLFCIDIVCHGVPSPKVWKEYIHWQESQSESKCVNVDFRNKRDFGWKSHIETLYFEDTNGINKKVNSDVFKNLFYGHNILRPACYKCPYKDILHPGDITIADFWGIDKINPTFDDDKGVSLVLINNTKGEALFNLVESTLESIKCNIEDSMQPPLIKPFDRPEKRDNFWKEFESIPFSKVANKYGKKRKSIVKALVRKVKKSIQ